MDEEDDEAIEIEDRKAGSQEQAYQGRMAGKIEDFFLEQPNQIDEIANAEAAEEPGSNLAQASSVVEKEQFDSIWD